MRPVHRLSLVLALALVWSMLAGLVAAVDPVYDDLARDRLTARLVGEIQALKRQTAPGSGLVLPAGCSA